jgi:hypothetical protein
MHPLDWHCRTLARRPLNPTSGTRLRFSLKETRKPAYTVDHSFMSDARALSYHDVVLRRADVDLLRGPHWLNDQVSAAAATPPPQQQQQLA